MYGVSSGIKTERFTSIISLFRMIFVLLYKLLLAFHPSCAIVLCVMVIVLFLFSLICVFSSLICLIINRSVVGHIDKAWLFQVNE